MSTNASTGPAPEPTPAATRPDGLWADDLQAGWTFRSGETEMTAEAIVAFASQYDPQPFHVDAAAAPGTFFNRLVASGWHTAAITMRLLVDGLPLATGIVGSGGQVAWPSATVPGDRLHVEGSVDSLVWSTSRPNQATIAVSHRTVNQHGEIRQRTDARLIVWKRPAG
ncbi:MaoC/PaaZ C-terminal domain-containing protein [Microbacterium sp.]|uniref:MaoC/PaaZ C-terminal domain-containing protein n=1 Tax=Microbacterium sp. TaxID=51671 RepID=UPI003A91B6E0